MSDDQRYCDTVPSDLQWNRFDIRGAGRHQPLSDERRRDLGNRLVGHGWPVELVAKVLHLTPKGTQ